ncbi:23S rRNA (uracil(1939)-C(5))-methyltransferase RlmD [Tepidimonas sediminis]|uniref:23S rRNA (uracil(1939)-C(5))-methyltransferase RlmD n=1 Tax=Tepidimonas sediminis TaxID=2588941 RepID=A0A554WJZ0_9BURK|nr:23S rRNA (uracil(1939)-C(5))-methyltransferase RlmD [Tepidimonas sediminis]TSE23892.1 23S rRNA (uracil(1939)-C(5))-methyltransferase RlmD [Tepidimonas sediminis]
MDDFEPDVAADGAAGLTAAAVSPLATPPRPAGVPAEALPVHGVDLEAHGIARRPDGKVVFVEGALPGEWVQVRVTRRKPQWEAAEAVEVHRPSPLRVAPRCPHFGLHAGACGGCRMQHIDALAQVAIKQRALEDSLWRLGKVRPQQILPPIAGPAWGYRWRARLAVRHVPKKGEVLVGFHERKSRYVADMASCAVLPPHVSALLKPLRALVMALQARDRCPQIELACGEGVTALVLRHLEPLTEADCDRLRAFAREHAAAGVQWWLQPAGPDSVHRLDEDDGTPELAYRLPEFDLVMPFRPTDFTQVNPHINRVLVARALRLLEARRGERVIDWFCGLGNFTLPIATQAGRVLGVEGSAALVQRAQANWAANQARRGGLAPTEFVARNLFEMTPAQLVADGVAQRWLVDPPREGAFALAKALADLHQAALAGCEAPHTPHGQPWQPPRRIVYVSCNPATLARDAGLLVHQAGYVCRAAGVVNMFPHTAHVESVAVFDRAAG